VLAFAVHNFKSQSSGSNNETSEGQNAIFDNPMLDSSMGDLSG
jgi:hypothetical protein